MKIIMTSLNKPDYLSEEENDRLLIPFITSREDLDEFEESIIQNVTEIFLSRRKLSITKILSENFIYKVHKKMFSVMWDMAGETRTNEKNSWCKM